MVHQNSPFSFYLKTMQTNAQKQDSTEAQVLLLKTNPSILAIFILIIICHLDLFDSTICNTLQHLHSILLFTHRLSKQILDHKFIVLRNGEDLLLNARNSALNKTCDFCILALVLLECGTVGFEKCL
jgi:hypothetical protein